MLLLVVMKMDFDGCVCMHANGGIFTVRGNFQRVVIVVYFCKTL